MALLKPSINAFSLLASNDPGDTYLGDVGAPDKDDAGQPPVNINKKQQPQMSVWKANKIKAEANAAKNKQQQPQPAASKAKSNNSTANVGKNRKPQQSAASKVQPSAAANAGKYKKPQQPAAASRASQAKTAANAATNEQFQQHPPAPVNLTQILFGNAYPSARALIYKNRKQRANANAKDGGGASGASATTQDKKGVHADGAAVKDDGPAPVQEEPPAPVKPVLPPPPPPPPSPSLGDSAQFPSLK